MLVFLSPYRSKELTTFLQQRFYPLVDYIEAAVCRLNGPDSLTPSDGQYQYQRALTLSKTLVAGLSDIMLAELVKLQNSAVSFKDSLQSSASSQFQSQMPQIHQSYADLSAALSSAVSELSSIMTNKEISLQEKFGRVGVEVCERIQPLLDSMMHGVLKLRARSESHVDSSGNGVKGRGGQ